MTKAHFSEKKPLEQQGNHSVGSSSLVRVLPLPDHQAEEYHSEQKPRTVVADQPTAYQIPQEIASEIRDLSHSMGTVPKRRKHQQSTLSGDPAPFVRLPHIGT